MKIIDTLYLQQESVHLFARAIGFRLTEQGHYLLIHNNKKYCVTPQKLVCLHNNTLVQFKLGNILKFGFEALAAIALFGSADIITKEGFLLEAMIAKAEGEKLVENAKLQWKKKDKEFIVQSHKVTFTEDFKARVIEQAMYDALRGDFV